MNSDFARVGVADALCAVLAERGITQPFPVQELVIPEALDGRDLQVKAPTGSGKTLAFGLPVIQAIAGPARRPSALVLAPTRELAGQITAELTDLARARGLSVAGVVGGVSMDRQARRAAKAEIIVATPGRLTDLRQRGLITLDGIRTLVLDEADRMLDMGFLPQVQAIVAHLPAERQTMLFSATLNPDVLRLAAALTCEPSTLEVVGHPTSGGEDPTSLEQSFVPCAHSARVDTLLDLINAEPGHVIVFCRTRRGAARLAEKLDAYGVPTGSLHGDLTQAKRDRALRSFATGRTRGLTATDVASRGIDLDCIELVVNYDPPEDHDTYTHRVGRTARAGRTGRAVTLVSPDQAAEVGRIARRLGLDELWHDTGYGPAVPQVVYRSRGQRGRPPARPSQAPRSRPTGNPTNRVRRGTRPPA